MEHSAGGESFPAFSCMNSIKISSHTKGNQRQRKRCVPCSQKKAGWLVLSTNMSAHTSPRMCHLSSLIPPKCPSWPLKLGTSLEKYIYKHIEMCLECLTKEGFVVCFQQAMEFQPKVWEKVKHVSVGLQQPTSWTWPGP